jgi:hypothetical protein
MGGLLTLDGTSPNVEGEKDQVAFNFNAPMEIVLTQMGDAMQEIINEIKKGGIQLIDHATSLLHVIASNV